MNVNQWIFFVKSLEIENEDTVNLHFELRPEDMTLYYVTDIIEDNLQTNNYELKSSSEINKWIELIIPIQQSMPDIHVSFNSKSKYLEYVIINRYQKDNIQIRVEEKRQQIKFTEPKVLEDLSLGKGFRITSIDKLKMKKAYGNYMFQLVEIRSDGERILSNNLPFPRPDETSISSPSDTVTTYYYI
ncbi:hypothetical protein D0T66_00475 [Dysgonomonas sp. 25]|nr:hypothetical protein [Dysgonomonas sp. 25]